MRSSPQNAFIFRTASSQKRGVSILARLCPIVNNPRICIFGEFLRLLTEPIKKLTINTNRCYNVHGICFQYIIYPLSFTQKEACMLFWLEKEAIGRSVFYYTAGSILFLLIWTPCILALLAVSGVDPSSVPDHTEKVARGSFGIAIITVLMEETAFRIVPLWLAVKNRFSTIGLIVLSVMNSAVFGYIHGSVYNLLLSGVGGFVFCLLFLKCGGIRSHFFPACTAPIVSHLFYDAIRFIIVLS